MNKSNEKRSMDNYHDDFLEYAKNRLLAYSGDLQGEEVEDVAYHSFHLLMNFDVRNAITTLLNVEEIMEEFENKFGDRYDRTCCDCCKEKLENGEDPIIEVELEDDNEEGC